MSIFLAFPVILLCMMLQMVVVNKIPLLYGYVDLIILVLIVFVLHSKTKAHFIWAILAGLLYGSISKLHWLVPLLSFLLIVWAAENVKKRIWQIPVIAYLFLVIGGTFLFQFSGLVSLKILGSVMPIGQSINLIVIPSVLLNTLFAIPVYFIFNDFLDVVFAEKN